MAKSELEGNQYDPSIIEGMTKEDIAKSMMEEHNNLLEKESPKAVTPAAQQEEEKKIPEEQIEATEEIPKTPKEGEESPEGEEGDKSPAEKEDDNVEAETENMSPKAALRFKKLFSEKNEALREKDAEIERLKNINADPEQKALQEEVDNQVAKLIVNIPSAKEHEAEIKKLCFDKDLTADQANRIINPAAYVDQTGKHDGDIGKYSGAGRAPRGNELSDNTDAMKMPIADLKKAAAMELQGL